MYKINYSQCWEDPLIIKEVLNISKKDVVLSISSGGDNSLFLLSLHPKEVISIDNNPFQNYLLELKLIAINLLPYNILLEFLGITQSKKRTKIYETLKDHLNPNAKKFWDKKTKLIRKGIIHIGKFERYLNLFRKIIVPLVLSKKQINELLNLSLDQQEKFYFEKIESRIWRTLFKIFFSERLMKILGREKRFFKYNKKNVQEEYYKRTKRGLTQVPIKNNYFMRYILTGEYALENLPEYLKKENIKRIKNNGHRIKIITSGIEKINTKIDKFNLSDIFELYSTEESNQILEVINQNAKKGSKILFWENLVETKDINFGRFRYNKKISKELSEKDRLFFYKGISCFIRPQD